MTDKILKFIRMNLNLSKQEIEDVVKKQGKHKTIYEGLKYFIVHGFFNKDELRKELSIYIERIISINEFEQLLDLDAIEYARILD